MGVSITWVKGGAHRGASDASEGHAPSRSTRSGRQPIVIGPLISMKRPSCRPSRTAGERGVVGLVEGEELDGTGAIPSDWCGEERERG